MSILSNFELDDFLKKLNINDVQIISKDQLKNMKNYNKFIINMDNSNNNGTHWVSLYDNFYFDSYGLEAPNEVYDFLNKQYYYNNQQYQKLYDTNCGWYSIIFFLYFKNKKINKASYNSFCKLLNLYNNDEIIITYILKSL